MEEVRSVLFDFDGLIADTEPLHFATFRQTLLEYDVELPPGTGRARFMGIHDRASFAIAFEESGKPLDQKTLTELLLRKARLYQEGIGEIEIFDGVTETLASIPPRLPFTIASGGRRSEISTVLENHGLAELFPSFICSDDIDKSKPDPECFLKGLELLQRSGHPDLTATTCLTFEDSFRGVEAAGKAGMMCIAVTNSYGAEDLREADQVLASLREWAWS